MHQATKMLIGMLHLDRIRNVTNQELNATLENAREDMTRLVRGGLDAVCIINESDIPHQIRVNAEEARNLQTISSKLRQACPVKLGICVLYNDWHTALDIALRARLEFVRIDTFVDTMQSDAGIIYPEASKIYAYRQAINFHGQLFTDIQVKHKKVLHGHPWEWSAGQAFEAGSDGVIVTGPKTGSPPSLAQVQKLCKAFPGKKILIGSGMNTLNISTFLPHVDGFFIGTALKENSRVDQKKVADFVRRVRFSF